MANTPNSVGHEAVGSCVDAHGGAIGLPQLCVDWIPNQIFWLLVALVVIYFLLAKIAMPRIGAILAERKGAITNDLAAAEELKKKALEAEAAYTQALADARTEAAKVVAKAKADIQADLNAATAKADAEIAARAAESERRINDIRASALDNVTEVAKETAEALVAALGGQSDAAKVADAVAARVKG